MRTLNRSEKLKYLIDCMAPSPGTLDDGAELFKTFRGLVNVREPKPAGEEFMRVQDELLQEEALAKGMVDIEDIKSSETKIFAKGKRAGDKNIFLWQGDITRLKVDAIVNAANSGMLGCFYPCHGCIDNCIHTYAGVQLRLECAELMKRQGHREPTGSAKLTKGYNLPCRYIAHTVGPIIQGKLTEEDCRLLESCYESCLELAKQRDIKTIAFCCISTGEFHFPNDIAAQIAIRTARNFLLDEPDMKVIFNVFKDKDFELYRELMG